MKRCLVVLPLLLMATMAGAQCSAGSPSGSNCNAPLKIVPPSGGNPTTMIDVIPAGATFSCQTFKQQPSDVAGEYRICPQNFDITVDYGPSSPAGDVFVTFKGSKGDTGATGAQGPMGAQGIQGIKGDPGQSIVGPQGAKGDKGDTGATGAPGQPPAMSVGLTTTGLPGTAAGVSLDPSSTSTNEILNFVIPQGATGPAGVTGAPGLKGDTGATGVTGPQGIQGIQGIQGPPGSSTVFPVTITCDIASGGMTNDIMGVHLKMTCHK